MKLLRFVSIKLTLFLVLGIMLGDTLPIPVPYALIFTSTSLAVLAFTFYSSKRERRFTFEIWAALTVIGIGLLAVTQWQPKSQKQHYTNFQTQGSNTLKIKIQEVLKATAFYDSYIVLVQETNGKYSSGTLILSIPIDSTKSALEVDSELVAFGSLNKIKAPLNPYQFDYRNYLEGLGIYHQLRITSDSYDVLENPSSTVYGVAATAREKIITKLQKAGFGQNELSILQALLLGQRNSISPETYTAYTDAGAVHILAVSGLHIGVLLMLLQLLLRPLEALPKGKNIKLALTVALLWCFALLAGMSASIVRAVTMFSFVAYALYLNRPSNTFNILALSMFFILLLFNPMLLFHVGFQMSYAAVFAIVWIYPKLQRFWNPKNRILKKIWQLLSVSSAAQLGVLPISIFYFHQFPGLFFLSNLLIVPFLGLLLGMGVVVIVLALADALPDFIVTMYNEIIGLMNATIAWVAEQEGFIIKNISFDSLALIIAYLMIFTLVLWCSKPTFKKAMVFLMALIAFQLWLFYTEVRASRSEKTVLLHQTKNSVLLHKRGHTLVIRASKNEKAKQLLTNYMTGEHIRFTQQRPLKNWYRIGDKKLLLLDSTEVYNASSSPDLVLLIQSPKLNLERLLDSLQPKQVIADGSNYSTYVKRWRSTCQQRKLPFHYTGEKGAYYFE